MKLLSNVMRSYDVHKMTNVIYSNNGALDIKMLYAFDMHKFVHTNHNHYRYAHDYHTCENEEDWFENAIFRFLYIWPV